MLLSLLAAAATSPPPEVPAATSFTGITWLNDLIEVGSALVTVGIIWRSIRKAGAIIRKAGDVWDAILGSEDPLTKEVHPGMANRLKSLEDGQKLLTTRTAQLEPNSGSSMYDRMGRVEASTQALTGVVNDLREAQIEIGNTVSSIRDSAHKV